MCNGTAIAADVIAAGGSAPYYGLEGCMEARLQYWVRKPDDSFAMSETRPMAIRAKPYDFARLSDDSAAVEVRTPPNLVFILFCSVARLAWFWISGISHSILRAAPPVRHR